MSPSLPLSRPRKKWLKPTSYSVADEANVEMWPPMPSSTLVGADHHRHGVPAHDALDAALDLAAAGIRHLLVGVDGVDVRRVRRERQLDAALLGVDAELAQQPADARRPSVLQHVVQRLEPLAGFEGFELGGISRSGISHGRARTFLRGSVRRSTSLTDCSLRLMAGL